MMKRLFILLFVLFITIDVSAAKAKTCVKNDYKSGEYMSLGEYDSEISAIYSGATDGETYSSILCKKTLVLSTPGDAKNVPENNYHIYSGLGFSYGPIVIKEIYSCTGTIKYAKITCDYDDPEKKDDSSRNAMKNELKAYIEWTNTKFDQYMRNLASTANTTVKIDMTESGMSNDVKEKMKQNENTIVKNSRIVSSEFTQKESHRLNESRIDGKKKSEVFLWQKVVEIKREYYPVQKQIILNGNREGEVLSINTTCPTGYTCRALEGNKVYTDFSMGTGVHTIKVSAKLDSLTINSTCGYVIYNDGAQGWYELLNYRQVDPSKPFPNGVNEMWQNNTNLFGKEFNNPPLIVFNLAATLIPRIREYNKSVGVYKKVKPSNSNYTSDYFEKYGGNYTNIGILKG